MTFLRYPALMGALLLLAGCVQAGNGSGMFRQPCKAPTSRLLAGVDWQSARKINLRIRQDIFTPAYIGLAQGRPYRLMIENADDARHVFRAQEFFKSVVLSDARAISGPGADGKKDYACSGIISIAPGGVTEVRIIPVRDGVYEFDSTPMLLSFVGAGGAGGFIVIEPKHTIAESPVKHLQLLKRKPLVTAPVAAPSGGLFDDAPAPGQPSETAPTVPVEELPVQEMPKKEKQSGQAPASSLFSD